MENTVLMRLGTIIEKLDELKGLFTLGTGLADTVLPMHTTPEPKKRGKRENAHQQATGESQPKHLKDFVFDAIYPQSGVRPEWTGQPPQIGDLAYFLHPGGYYVAGNVHGL